LTDTKNFSLKSAYYEHVLVLPDALRV